MLYAIILIIVCCGIYTTKQTARLTNNGRYEDTIDCPLSAYVSSVLLEDLSYLSCIPSSKYVAVDLGRVILNSTATAMLTDDLVFMINEHL